MAIWGIGAFYNSAEPADKTEEFINNDCACIGWNNDEAPALHLMLNSIKLGDIMYIKSFIPKTKQLNIKAVGIVNDTMKKPYENLGTGVSVIWKEDFEPFTIAIDNAMYKNNVFNNTLYEEYNLEIINKIIDTFI